MIDLPGISQPSAPGSFTKNPGFGLHGEGLSGLHAAIRLGFDGALNQVPRDILRARVSPVFGVLELWLPNFFLFNLNVQGQVASLQPDEFVLQAVLNRWTPAFDYLAFGTFHLNWIGQFSGQRETQRFPTLWAYRYLEQIATSEIEWDEGIYQADAIEAFLRGRANFQAETTRKVATNYAYLIGASGLRNSSPEHRRRRFNQLGRAPIFLALDRLELQGRSVDTRRKIRQQFPYERLGVCFGVGEAVVEDAVAASSDLYLSFKGHKRFGADIIAERVDDMQVANDMPANRLLILDEATKQAQIEYELRTSYSRVRNRFLSTELKMLYGFSCAVCGGPLVLDPEIPAHYGEAAHIRPLGDPHLGDDLPSNMIILCPNHHIQFDRGTFTITRDRGRLRTISALAELDGATLSLNENHVLSDENLTYHQQIIFQGRR